MWGGLRLVAKIILNFCFSVAVDTIEVGRLVSVAVFLEERKTYELN